MCKDQDFKQNKDLVADSIFQSADFTDLYHILIKNYISGLFSRIGSHMTLLTLSEHEHEGYSSRCVCLSIRISKMADF